MVAVDIFDEAFHFLKRIEIERLRILARAINNVVSKSSKSLPLRTIDNVQLDCCKFTCSALVQWTHPDPPEAFSELEYDDIFLRLNNAIIKRLTACWFCTTFFVYWHSRRLDNNSVLVAYRQTRCHRQKSPRISQDIAERQSLLLRNLKTTVYELEHWEEYPNAFPFVEYSASLRIIRQLDLYCVRNIYGTLPPSLLEYVVATRELWSCNISCDFQTTYTHVNPWISEFIEKHRSSSDNAPKLPNVTIIKPFDGPAQLPEQCGRPAQTDVPAPDNEFIDRFRDPRKYRKMPASLFVFKNQSGNRELRLYSFLIVQPMSWLNHPILPALQGQPHMYQNPQPPRSPMNRPFDVVYYIESD